MVGQNIGKYRVLDRVGRGGMGTVYRAIDETLHREVAIKVLNAELNDPEVAKRFRAEAITVARLSHPGIATIYELFQHEGQWLMVMEFVRGETLDRMVERMGALSPQRSAELCMQTLAALAHAHSMGVVHRDLKPANIMITETGAIKIMDFGIARVAGTEHLTSAGFMMGTPAYMAPEQVMGHEIDARADLYAMGVVFYRLTTAKLPFNGETPFAMAQSQVNDAPTPIGMFRADLPSWVEQVVVRSLAKKPEERFQSAVEFHESFARCLAGLPMAVSYSSMAPTELMMTPSRPMPTSSIHRTVTSAQLPATPPPGDLISGTLPTVAAPTPVKSPSQAVPAAVLAAAQAAAAAIPATAHTSAGGTGQGSARAASEPQPLVAAVPPAKKSSNVGLIAAGVVLVAVGIGAAFFLRRGGVEAPAPAATQASIPAPAEVPPATPPAPTVSPTPAPPAPIAPAAGAAAPAPGGTGTPAAARGPAGTPPAGTAAAGTGAAGAPAGTGRATAGGRATTPPADDTLQEFANVRFVAVNGRRISDREIVLNFAGGQITATPKDGGNAIFSVPYRAIRQVTYVRARDPRWDSTLAGPPQDLDTGGPFRTSKHWAVVQTGDAYWILRLEDINVIRVLQTFEARTGITVNRPRQNDGN